MKRYFQWITGISSLLLSLTTAAQNSAVDSSAYYDEVSTYVNPVLPGDHPDPTLLKFGDDFYHCVLSFILRA